MKKTFKITALSTLIIGFFVSVASAKDLATYIDNAYRKIIENQIYTEKQADSLWWKLNERDMILTPIKEYDDLGDKFYDSKLSSDESLNITRLLVDYPSATATYLHQIQLKRSNCLQNIREVWLSPQVDVWAFIDDLQSEFIQDEYQAGTKDDFIKYEDKLWFSGGMMNGFCTIYVPESELPKGLLSYSSKPLSSVYFVKVYSGDVYEAFKKGDSAAREWCPGHVYTGKAYTASRMKQHMTCRQPNEWYYSCKWCGKCEYNPKHTFSDGGAKSPVHDFARFDISDKNYIGTNKQGEEVYCLSCRWCGINKRDSDLSDFTYEYFLRQFSLKNSPEVRAAYNMYKEQNENSWKKGGANYEMALNVSTKVNLSPCSFAVPKSKDVKAKISENAQDGVYWAARNGLVDEEALGDDFTKPLTRLQASAIAVTLAEKLSGKSISPAKSKTYSDTKSKYALKAAGAGIYGGASEGKFNPDGAVDRQQLATFFYQALMYAKKNKNVRYTPYESKLDRYSDSESIADWAKEAVAFMDALGLVDGSSRTKFLPEETYSIEQALVIANNSLDAPNIGWYQSGPSDTDKLELRHFTNDFQVQNCGNSTQLDYRYYERFWRPVAMPEAPAAASILERFAILDPYTNERLYARKINFFAVKAE
ncbi:MAG: S-layer homology domain-containing protein [Spirochaetales bacterium]|nr:S-layer homology domain-containing protein [Spirochaetales bacterium]